MPGLLAGHHSSHQFSGLGNLPVFFFRFNEGAAVSSSLALLDTAYWFDSELKGN